MIVAIERNKFNYLFKYNQIKIDVNQVYDNTIDEIKRLIIYDRNIVISRLSEILPTFEQDHEILILELDKSKVQINNGIVLYFDSVVSIIPLTKIGGQLLDGKLNNEFKINSPFLESLVEEVILLRSIDNRKQASLKLLSIFKVENLISDELRLMIENSIILNINNKNNNQELKSYLDHLIGFNKTPSYIPEGNIEFICKIGAIAMKYLGKPDEVFKNGPFYKCCLTYKLEINSNNLFESYESFLSVKDESFKAGYEKIVELISNDFKGFDVFKASYYFLAFKSKLNNNDNNLAYISEEIKILIKKDKGIAIFVLNLIGYVFSFENLYESIHKFSNAPLFQKRNKIEIKTHTENIVEPIKEEISKPVVIYEPSIEDFEKNDKNSIVYDIDETSNIQDSTTSYNEVKIKNVQSFKEWLIFNLKNPKKKDWIQFIDYYFNDKLAELNFDNLINIIAKEQNLSEKLIKTKKDKDLIKSFFEL